MQLLVFVGFALISFVAGVPLNKSSVVPRSNITFPSASVNTTGVQPSSNAEGSTLSEELFSNLKLYAQYSAAAYCIGVSRCNSGPIACNADVAPLLQRSSVNTMLVFDDDPKSDERGFIALDHQAKQIILSFRGSLSIRNIVYDILLWRDKVSDICEGCEAHHGFKAAWLHNKDAIIPAIKLAVAEYPDYKLIVTGHSLGGAVASIAGACLRSIGLHADIYTYGAPRSGNKAFVDFLSSSADITARVTHSRDVIPKVPWMFMGYHHTSPEYWLSSGPDQAAQAAKDDYGIEDVKVCNGVDNQDCNGSTWFAIDIMAHKHYFEHVIGCTVGVKW